MGHNMREGSEIVFGECKRLKKLDKYAVVNNLLSINNNLLKNKKQRDCFQTLQKLLLCMNSFK